MCDGIKIKIIGIGGAGCNIVGRLSEKGDDGLKNVGLYAANTDSASLNSVSDGIIKIQLKANISNMGAGLRPEVGIKATRDAKDKILEGVGDANLLFVTAGMGGGTGTGGASVIAEAVRKHRKAEAPNECLLVVGVITMPFAYEGEEKMRIANEGAKELRKHVDVLIPVSNQKAMELMSDRSYKEVFARIDEVLFDCITGITNTILLNSTVNVDFADLVTILAEQKTVHIGVGAKGGNERLCEAIADAASDELVGTTIENARNIIVHFELDCALTTNDVEKAVNLIKEVLAPDANIKYGFRFDERLNERVKVTMIASGLDAGDAQNSVRLEFPVFEREIVAPDAEESEELADSQIADIMSGLADGSTEAGE